MIQSHLTPMQNFAATKLNTCKEILSRSVANRSFCRLEFPLASLPLAPTNARPASVGAASCWQNLRSIVPVIVAIFCQKGAALAADYQKEYATIVQDQTASDSDRLNRLFTVSWDQRMHDAPEFATMVGYPGLNDKWPDSSWDAIQRRKLEAKQRLDVVKSINRQKLSKDEQPSFDMFRRDLEESIEGQVFPNELLPISQMEGVQQVVPDTIIAMPHVSTADYENILARLRGLPVLIDQNIDLLKRGIVQGIVQPAVPIRDLPSQILTLIPDDPFKSALLQHFNNFPSGFPEQEKERLRADAAKAYTQQAEPAFRKLYKFIRKDYIPASRETLSLTALPNGEAWYAYRVRKETTTSMTPKEIHELGLREVARIRSEMDKVIADAKFQGTFEEFIEFIKTDPRFFFKRPEDFLAEYREIAMRISAELPKFFGKLPRLTCGVKATPAYAEVSAPDAIYEFGSMKAGRAGYFVANTSRLETRPSWEMATLTAHEAVPGHHLQISLAQEVEVPEFRRFNISYTGYIEGWAVYAESLGFEMGVYRDAYEKFGSLSGEMWRACRLVVDTGLHGMGWNRQQAIDYIVKNTGSTELSGILEVDRYIVWPGQAVAYKVGERKIRELRNNAQNDLGDAFDLRAFHDLVLSQGAIPLDLLEKMVEDWVAQQKTDQKKNQQNEAPQVGPKLQLDSDGD